MKSLSKEGDPNFRKTLIRDALVMLMISAISAIGIVLTLYYSVKNNW